MLKHLFLQECNNKPYFEDFQILGVLIFAFVTPRLEIIFSNYDVFIGRTNSDVVKIKKDLYYKTSRESA